MYVARIEDEDESIISIQAQTQIGKKNKNWILNSTEKQGWLKKKARNEWKRRYVVLDNSKLSYFSSYQVNFLTIWTFLMVGTLSLMKFLQALLE